MSLCCHHTTYNITVTALNWFASYLCEKKLSVWYNCVITTTWSTTKIGLWADIVPTDVLALIEDMQLGYILTSMPMTLGFCAPAEASDLQQRISTCVDRVSEWM